MTWILEHETIDSPPGGVRLLQVECFTDLQRHF
jgi:hypothetical protein